MASFSKSILIPILLRKSLAEIEEIEKQAETVVLGGIASISALSQSTTFSPENAAVVLEACTDARAIKANGDTAAARPPALAHTLRFQPVVNPSGMTWGH